MSNEEGVKTPPEAGRGGPSKKSSRVTPTDGSEPAAPGAPGARKRKLRCNWNPSIWFELPNVIKFIAYIGLLVDSVYIFFWIWSISRKRDAIAVLDSDSIEVRMLVIHMFCLISNALLFVSVVLVSHILCYVWLFFRMIWFYLAAAVWISALNVVQMQMHQEWRRGKAAGDLVFREMGILDPARALIRWQIVFYSYMPILLLYAWGSVTVGVFACNLLEDFRRRSTMRPSIGMTQMSQDAMRRFSRFSGGSQVQTV